MSRVLEHNGYTLAMIPLCYAQTDAEVMYLRAMLQDAEIPFHIVGENFGSLLPGVQIPSYNERRFLVAEECMEDALEILEGLRENYRPFESELETRSKFRIMLEAVLFGWAVPAGRKKNSEADTDEA